MKRLSIDIETFSGVDLKSAGVYRYAEDPEFKILLIAYAFDNGPVKVFDVASGEEIPDDFSRAITDKDVIKSAFNAAFERVCLETFYKVDIPIEQWECTMVLAANLGLPLSLEQVASVLKLPQQKADGKSLIRYFSMPCKPTRSNGMRTRNMPENDFEKWQRFKDYCAQDVEVERAIREKLSFFEIPTTEKQLYALDQRINDLGIRINRTLVRNAIKIDAEYRQSLHEEVTDITDIDNPNSVSQLKDWLAEETGEDTDSLNKQSIKDMIEATDSDKVTRVLQIRQEMAKTSVKKYDAMLNSVCLDGRIRGLFQFYGANRTGRWAGRLVQVQNLPQNHIRDLDVARNLVKDGDGELLEMLYGNVPDTLSQLIRTAFIPETNHTFVVADFSAIEARVIAWLAGERWRIDVFNTHGKIYEASASQMFKVPVDSIKKGSDLRQKGKIAELALGYQGGTGALTTMGALRMGLKEEDLQPLVDAWRAANPAIVQLWADVNNAAAEAIRNDTVVYLKQGLVFEKRGAAMYVRLPSGRRLTYFRAKIGVNRYGSSCITYEGLNQTTKQWESVETYGGKLVENIVQAIARDCLAEAMLRLNSAQYRIVMHVHDEVVVEVPDNEADLERICSIMSEPISWAPGLPMRADGYVTPYYRKD